MRVQLQVGALALATVGAVARRRLTGGPLHPAWSFRTELVAALVRRMAERSGVAGPQWLRAAHAAMPSVLPPSLRALGFEPLTADGVPCEWVRPPRAADLAPQRAIVYVHGGGYVTGSVRTHREIAARLAAGVGVPVLSVDYRLAPEHRYPAAHDDCLRAVRWLRAQGVPPSRTAIAGDSAGGALALATMLALRDAGEAPLVGAALLCPWVDPMAAGGSMDANDRFDIVGRGLLTRWARTYADPDEIAAAPITLLSANLAGLPPLFVQWGELEVLRDQIVAFVARARAAGVTVTADPHPAVFHDFQVLASLVPAGDAGVERLVRFLSEALPAPPPARP